jgi:hypothetical protein
VELDRELRRGKSWLRGANMKHYDSMIQNDVNYKLELIENFKSWGAMAPSGPHYAAPLSYIV